METKTQVIFKNIRTGRIKKIFMTKRQYENLSFDFEKEWKQVG